MGQFSSRGHDPKPDMQMSSGPKLMIRSLRIIKFKNYSTTVTDQKKDILGMSLEDIQLLMGEHFERYRPFQAYQLIHQNKGTSWSDSFQLSKKIQTWLDDRCIIDHGSIISRQQSKDGSRKYLIKVSPSKSIESVLIPEEDRSTLCVSSQVGCSLQCKFCHTGTQKFESNLTSGEILRQFYAIPSTLRGTITNFVFMGQGEPLYNYKNLSKAITIMTDPNGMGFGRGKITVSTSGITPLIPKVASELKVNLAISLHSPNDDLRSQIMPINKAYPLDSLMKACKEFVDLSPCATRRISFEYVMLKGLNDTPQIAHQLVELIKPFPCHVNLIPFNPWPGSIFQCSSSNTIHEFCNILQRNHIQTTIRRTRGQDILAACGQLKSTSLSKEKVIELS